MGNPGRHSPDDTVMSGARRRGVAAAGVALAAGLALGFVVLGAGTAVAADGDDGATGSGAPSIELIPATSAVQTPSIELIPATSAVQEPPSNPTAHDSTTSSLPVVISLIPPTSAVQDPASAVQDPASTHVTKSSPRAAALTAPAAQAAESVHASAPVRTPDVTTRGATTPEVAPTTRPASTSGTSALPASALPASTSAAPSSPAASSSPATSTPANRPATTSSSSDEAGAAGAESGGPAAGADTGDATFEALGMMTPPSDSSSTTGTAPIAWIVLGTAAFLVLACSLLVRRTPWSQRH